MTPTQLLKLVSASDATFMTVESDEIEKRTGSRMASRIEFKYTLAGSPSLAADAFIDQYCTRSSLHGTDYQVLTKDGKTRRLADWLRDQANLTTPATPTQTGR